MAEKEDPMKSFGSVGVLGTTDVPLLGGRTLAEVEEEFKVEKETDWIPRALLHRMQMPADKEEADWISAYLLKPGIGSLALVEEEEEEEKEEEEEEDEEEGGAVIGAKRSAEDPEGEAADDSSDGAKTAAGDGGEEASAEEWVEMPEDYLRWLLAQTRETDPVPKLSDYNTQDPQVLKQLQEDIDFLQAAQDDFFEYQASVREKLAKNERVMVPAAAVGPTDQFQEAIDEFWYGLLKEYDNAGSSTEVAELSY